MKYSEIILTSLFLFFSCNKSETPLPADANSDLKITAGYICGWGSGTDSLSISRSIIKYFYIIPGKSQLPVIDKSRSVPDTEWIKIVNSVNLSEFQKLNYNSCNICVDGCDEWIMIKTEKYAHQIRFPKGLKIGSISNLQDKLTELRNEFGNRQ